LIFFQLGLVLIAPLLGVTTILVRIKHGSPVFFSQARPGLNGKPFTMYKFRTMLDTPVEAGQSVSPQYDPRVTTFGRFLRRTKINELPQFINILKGDMTFVGPRPEAPDLAELYPEGEKKIFSVKPGLVGPNAILGRNEEELYPPGVDAKKYYIEKILPKRVKLDLEYLDNPGFFKDLKYISMGVKVTLSGMISKRHIYDNRSQIYLLLCDLFLMLFSFCLASFLVSRMTFKQVDFPYLFKPTHHTFIRLLQYLLGMHSSSIGISHIMRLLGLQRNILQLFSLP
jgi:lipopolysaccharide/colanic/teichoic acid biosynthesis glycosyltransferase